jgi:Heterokaryon incompatibility protein (HET)
MRGVPLSDFPATLRDAVAVTRRFGIRHLWVDALCIKQDSQDDWLRESSRMREVYRGATLTLIAANAPSVDSGIFSKRTTKLASCPLPWNVPNGGGQISPGRRQVVHMRPCTWNQETEPWPTQQRGWTLQEDLLSPRTLSYSKGRMVWECSTHQVDEGSRINKPTLLTSKSILQEMVEMSETKLPLRMLRTVLKFLGGISARFELPKDPNRDPYYRWTIVVHEYTSRNLTKETDVLPGIAGLASEFARQMRDTYCAGLWRKELLLELMWSLDPGIPVPTEGPIQYLSPSWSWPSVRGAIRMESPLFLPARVNSAHERAKIVRIRVESLVSSDPFGQVKAGYLVLQGRFYHTGNFLESYSTTVSGPLPAAQKALRASILVAPAMLHEFRQQHKACNRQHFALLQLVSWPHRGMNGGADYLVLESANPDASVYRRIGFITLMKEPDKVPATSTVLPHDPLAFTFDEYNHLVRDAFRELQEATGTEKRVKII